jgi:glycosyltransferase involved in cell wall biosynthesis
VIIPAYNEEDKIEETIRGLIEIDNNMIDEIIVIDDGSTDKTREKVLKMVSNNVFYFSLSRNLGKGAALRKGLEIAKYPIIVFLDGDLGYTSKEITKLIKPVYDNEADVTIASFPSASIKGGFGIVKKVSKKGIQLLTGKSIQNPICGQRVFRRSTLSNIEIPNRFAVEVGMTIDLLNQNLRIREVPVFMKHRETKRNIQGFIHRGKELIDIIYILLKKYYKYKIVVNRW